jgi:hypothetical protein
MPTRATDPIEVEKRRRAEDILCGPGYSIWKYSAYSAHWKMVHDSSNAGYVPASAPKRPGKFDGEILRLVSVVAPAKKH